MKSTKRVLGVGNCAADQAALRQLIVGQMGATLDAAHSCREALQLLAQQRYDLVLVNRIFDRDGTEGLDLLRQIKALPDPQSTAIPVMLITNYANYQAEAVALGGVPGFGKAALDDEATLARLQSYLATE